MAESFEARLLTLGRRRTGDVLLAAASFYVVVTGASIVTAHIVAVISPGSALPERLVRPVGVGLAFVDVHWKALLIVVAPVVAPLVRDLVRRLRKAGTMEFDVDVETEGPREKPRTRRLSDSE